MIIILSTSTVNQRYIVFYSYTIDGLSIENSKYSYIIIVTMSVYVYALDFDLADIQMDTFVQFGF